MSTPQKSAEAVLVSSSFVPLRYEDALYAALFRTVHHGASLGERLGGVAALEALVGAPSAEPETKGIKFANVRRPSGNLARWS